MLEGWWYRLVRQRIGWGQARVQGAASQNLGAGRAALASSLSFIAAHLAAGSLRARTLDCHSAAVCLGSCRGLALRHAAARHKALPLRAEGIG